MHVIGTAGHVDHGKSALVEALTGTHPDRLKEEREREMTIDLGFAWLTLPTGEEIGIIDVPGHRDFIENMLAGVGGIEAALFVIAADEGVMPQTKEHLAILDLLEIQGGVIALTKVDLIDDPDWLDLVEEDVRRAMAGTVLAAAPIVRVSSRTRVGLETLKQELGTCLAHAPAHVDLGRPRLPIDRIFSIAGFGTVVTGTLSDGYLRLGDELEILPAGLKGRVRGLQTHKRKEEAAVPGSRTAVNLTGVTLDRLKRGDVVAHPNTYRPTGRLDVHFRVLPDVLQPIRHNMTVKLFVGAAEMVARLRLLGVDELKAGESGWLQLEVEQPVVVVRGDRYILRRPSPGETLGGGMVVDPHPKGRHKRYSEESLQRLSTLAKGTPSEILLQALIAMGFASLKEVIARSNLDGENASAAVRELIDSGQMVFLEDETPQVRMKPEMAREALVTSRINWEQVSSRCLQELREYHRFYPLRSGIPREELKSRLSLPARIFNTVIRRLVDAGELQEKGPQVRISGHEIRLSPVQQQVADALLARFNASPYSPPSYKEAQAEIGDELFAALVELGKLVSVSADVIFSREAYESMSTQVKSMLAGGKSITAAQVRDHFNTSRRYVLAFLEHLDAIGVTIREGDTRRLK